MSFVNSDMSFSWRRGGSWKKCMYPFLKKTDKYSLVHVIILKDTLLDSESLNDFPKMIVFPGI